MLAEPARLRVVAALVLGASTAAEVSRMAGLEPREVGTAVRRLQAGGLLSADQGELRLREERFKEAARAEAPPAPPDEQLSADPATAAVLRAFTRGGRLVGFPVARRKRRLLLEHVAAAFEPGVRYREREVDAILRAWHDDYAQLRRYLVDAQLLDRSHGEYWRIGGWVDTLPAAASPAEEQAAAAGGRQRIGVYGLAERDGQVLLTRLARGMHRGRWTLPGGRLEFGERPVDALARELREETGLEATIDSLLDVDAAVVDFQGRSGPVRTHLVPIVYRVTVVGGTLGVTEADGSTDDARWWHRGRIADEELTPFAGALLRTGRLTG